jgi:tRNA(Ile)-lysidine synthase
VFAAHLNHGIRGEDYSNEAERDEAFCREMCEKLDVELFVRRIDIPKLAAESGKSLETEARDARYSFFSEIMREQGIKILATAHNADDNLETQIYNLMRGCGIDGLIGIPESRPLDYLDGAIVIRPLLKATKSEILDYCAENGVEYVTDSTNFEDSCTRNVIRHKVVPVLEETFSAAKRSALRLSASAGEDADFILGEALKIVDGCDKNKISVPLLRETHPALAKRVIMILFERATGEGLEYVHLSDILSLLCTDKNGAMISLPKKARACVVDGMLCFEKDTVEQKQDIKYSQTLRLGFNRIDGTQFAVLLSDTDAPQSVEGYSLYASAKIKAERAGELYAENRREGLSILSGGINKKLKKLMCDKKVPLYDRDDLPLICSWGEVLYAPLCAIRDTVRAGVGDKALHIGIYKQNGG